MKILVACEESQTVTKAFRAKGHEAYSADILPCSGGHPEWHIQGDVIAQLDKGWDMMIGHPPCTYLSYAGTHAWNLPGRLEKRLDALNFFAQLWLAPIDKICLENPKSCASPTIAKYNQQIQPFYFGDNHLKTTWLWLKNLPMLTYRLQDELFGERTATDYPEPIYIDKISGKKRYFTDAETGRAGSGAHERAKTFQGIAKAMAEQWAGNA